MDFYTSETHALLQSLFEVVVFVHGTRFRLADFALAFYRSSLNVFAVLMFRQLFILFVSSAQCSYSIILTDVNQLNPCA